MRLTRIFVEQPLVSGKGVGLPEQAGQHLTRVLRLEAGAAAHAVRRRRRRIRRHARARRQEDAGRGCGAHDPPSSASRRWTITLMQGVARGERMDLIVQKATELGVTRIVPVLAERSVVKVDASKRARKLEHWRSIAISACEQCGRNRVPEVAEPIALGDAVRALEPGAARYLLAAGARDRWRRQCSGMPASPSC